MILSIMRRYRSDTRRLMWGLMIMAAIIGAIVGLFRPHDFFASWLAAILWPWSVCFGALTFRLIRALTGGRWGVAVLPWLTVLIRPFPLVALLFVPWPLGLNYLYPWTDPETFAGLKHVSNRQWFYQSDFVILRTVAYFCIWWGLAVLVAGLPRLRGTQSVPDRSSTSVPGGEAVAGLGLVALLLTSTWAAGDWVMSLDPFFVSTLFGALFGMGALLTGLSLVIALWCISNSEPQTEAETQTEARLVLAETTKGAGHSPQSEKADAVSQLRPAAVSSALPDLANLLLGFVMLWAYLQFSQFLMMWSGNLPIEAMWYQSRNWGVWNLITLVLTFGGFFVSLASLMSHDFKRSLQKTGTLAVCLAAVRILELWWMILPSSPERAATIYWGALPCAVFVHLSGRLLSLKLSAGAIQSANSQSHPQYGSDTRHTHRPLHQNVQWSGRKHSSAESWSHLPHPLTAG